MNVAELNGGVPAAGRFFFGAEATDMCVKHG